MKDRRKSRKCGAITEPRKTKNILSRAETTALVRVVFRTGESERSSRLQVRRVHYWSDEYPN